MRLTEKIEKGCYADLWKNDYQVKEQGYESLENDVCEAIDKLGQLEDIEEELGIDLLTLINALTHGVWLRNGKRLEHHKVFLCKSDGDFALGYNWSDKYGLQGRCLKTKKYRQHWALTKEELE